MNRSSGAILASSVAVGAHSLPLILSVGGIRERVSQHLCGRGDLGGVSLTFDDGPDRASTPLFIEELDRLKWSATFFLLGSMTRQHPDVARQLVDAGHEVAVHGDRHRNHVLRRPHEVREDMLRATDSIATITGTSPRWYRPPYGAVSWATLATARELSLDVVLWTTWGRDWRRRATPRSIHDDVMGGLDPGGTILLHDSDCTSSTGSWKATLAALPLLSTSLDRRDLAVRPLGDHLAHLATASGVR